MKIALALLMSSVLMSCIVSEEKKEETGPYAYSGRVSNPMYTIVKVDSSICLKINAVKGDELDSGAIRYTTCNIDFQSYLLQRRFPHGGYILDTLDESAGYEYKVEGYATFKWPAPAVTPDWQPAFTSNRNFATPLWTANSMTAGYPLHFASAAIWDRTLPEIYLAEYRLDFTRVIKP